MSSRTDVPAFDRTFHAATSIIRPAVRRTPYILGSLRFARVSTHEGRAPNLPVIFTLTTIAPIPTLTFILTLIFTLILTVTLAQRAAVGTSGHLWKSLGI